MSLIVGIQIIWEEKLVPSCINKIFPAEVRTIYVPTQVNKNI